MNHQINRLLNFALQKGMIGTDDLYYAANLIRKRYDFRFCD